jgi:hypothetical protein
MNLWNLTSLQVRGMHVCACMFAYKCVHTISFVMNRYACMVYICNTTYTHRYIHALTVNRLQCIIYACVCKGHTHTYTYTCILRDKRGRDKKGTNVGVTKTVIVMETYIDTHIHTYVHTYTETNAQTNTQTHTYM